MTKRYVSGIQPSGDLHLGNYFGAIAQHIKLQHLDGEQYYFIADYHALTSLKDGKQLRQYTKQIAATYVALGLDTDKAVLFKQSDVPEVQELAWMLNCVLGVGVLLRCHAYKDKVDQGLMPNAGLLTYPVLMAADILIYGGTHVPVGQDQAQHLEVARDLASAFNSAFGGKILIKPEVYLGTSPLVPGTDGRKMSKSYGNTIPIFSRGKPLKKRVNAIVTDSKVPGVDIFDPDTCNAFAIYKMMSSADRVEELRDRYLHDRTFLGYGITKKLIMEAHQEFFGKAHDRYLELIDVDNSEIDEILKGGAERARARARITIGRCRKITGLESTTPRINPGAYEES
jgi:tryptophanyl-tRNA synthetase